MVLEIAIPTFNRADYLAEQLRRLFLFRKELPVKITVFDNGSSDHTFNVVSPYIGSSGFRYHKTNRNCGISRNIMRCFEETDGDWVWTLSDDNPILPEALETILSQIEKNTADIWTFKTIGNSVANDVVCKSIDEFLKVQTLLDLGYLTATVYSRPAIQAGIGVLAPGGYSLLPHCLLAIAAVRAGFRQGFSTKVLCEQVDGDKRIARKEFALGAITTLEFFSTKSQKVIHARALRSQTRWMLISALAQCDLDADFTDWKRFCRIVNYTLSVSGATFFNAFGPQSYHSGVDKRREWIIQVLLHMPIWVLRKLARSLARKTGQSKIITTFDNQA